MLDGRIDKLAQILVGYSTGVRAGEVVSLVGPPLAEPLITALYRQVLKAGAQPFVLMTPPACQESLLRLGTAAQLEFVNPLEQREVECADVAIHVLASENTRSLTSIDPARQALRSQARQPLMEKFMRRAGAGSLRWVATQFPCQASAQDAEMSLSEYEEFVFTAGMLDKDDPAQAWESLADAQCQLAETLGGIHELRFVTPRGTDLRVAVAGRSWINCAGHENFPDGEVFTGPLENATEGIVCYDFPAVHGGREVEGIRLAFRAGRVVEASARKGEDFLLRMLDQDAGARVLGEIALGCNYGIARHTRNTLFDEKIGGTFHAALGAAYPESGGKNVSGLHWDMVCDLRAGGILYANGQAISENGRFLDPSFPQPLDNA